MYREMYFLMYDAQILPIVMYRSELWGFQQFAVINKKKKKKERKSKRLRANDFECWLANTKRKCPMVTWADILCLLHLLYDV